MTLTEILPAVRQLPVLDKLRLIRILADEKPVISEKVRNPALGNDQAPMPSCTAVRLALSNTKGSESALATWSLSLGHLLVIGCLAIGHSSCP
ncbi:MAG: hypothetical protein FJ272_18100 [Planctomycetes bacterium]|nr:hypothetical protein [Planctomycetota bacterium]MBM4086702.1 hypothetical protein [Planctomycetota bacterium]